MEIKPNFLIIGAMKAATTSLYTILRQHPDIFMSNIKEPMFFNNINTKNYITKGRKQKRITTIEEYYSLFNNVKNETAIGEASPSYIYDKDCPFLIKKYLPHAKLIVILRQPIDRGYSNYLHVKRSGREPLNNFKDSLAAEEKRIAQNWSPLYHYKKKGLYSEQLSRYYKFFAKKNIHVLLFEDIIKDQKKTTKKIFSFLDVDSSFLAKDLEAKNISGIPKGILGWLVMKMRYYKLIPNIELSNYLPTSIINLLLTKIYSQPKKLEPVLRKNLTNLYYKEDILKLEKLINKDLGHWLN